MRRALWIVAALIALALPFLVSKSFYLQIAASAYITAIVSHMCATTSRSCAIIT